ncbi:hypothetical protein [Natronobeatus ordinarius]|uniref:hypothetical protein n=1 Tax=Natronobeatus ordinarius TaxID=2963433 RepID=UPI0020CECDA7|nr:hypothetical protein [Natronobeatus ordinarius]
MNHLEPAAENRWKLPRHAHLVIYEREGDGGDDDDGDGDQRGLLTIYDCGAAQKPPSAQLLGTLESVDARAEIDRNPTGRVVRMREQSILERRPGDRFRIVRR